MLTCALRAQVKKPTYNKFVLGKTIKKINLYFY